MDQTRIDASISLGWKGLFSVYNKGTRTSFVGSHSINIGKFYQCSKTVVNETTSGEISIKIQQRIFYLYSFTRRTKAIQWYLWLNNVTEINYKIKCSKYNKWCYRFSIEIFVYLSPLVKKKTKRLSSCYCNH